ncbi:serpin 1 [Hypsugopox virus]|nr:serpin 1 [Hypsugopox virus]
MINFAIKLFKEFEHKNVIFSPPSIVSTLMMIAAGADGDTKKEIDSIIKNIPHFTTSKQLQLVNRIYIDELIKYTNTFKQNVSKMNADIVGVNFKNTQYVTNLINSWIYEATSIDNFINAIDEQTRIMMVNAISFTGEWCNKFDSSDNVNKKFKSGKNNVKIVKMMMGEMYTNVGTLCDINATIVELKYKNKYNMVIIMPNDVEGLQTMIQSLTSEKFNEWVSSMSQKNICLYIPKFNIQQTIDLQYYLPKLGIHSVTSNINLSKISKNCFDQPKFMHKSYVNVDEEGTKAAAVSCFSVINFSCVERDIIKINKPFMFCIRKNNNIVFMGKVVSL